MRSILSVLLVICVLASVAYGMGKKEEGTPVQFEVVDSSERGGTSEELFLIAKAEKDFKYIWDLTHRQIEPKPEMPSIDFGEYVVACIMMGERSTSGYSVDVSDVVAYKDSVVVGYTYDESGGMLTVMSYPYEIIKFPKTSNKIVFKKRQ
ncbi:MAG: protease complex subunit PrcB family protein [candidate division Zixibacteria bacterium]|nr:protease complex subunit PrcB family protein [candidate division Zixibacteria bacterium]